MILDEMHTSNRITQSVRFIQFSGTATLEELIPHNPPGHPVTAVVFRDTVKGTARALKNANCVVVIGMRLS